MENKCNDTTPVLGEMVEVNFLKVSPAHDYFLTAYYAKQTGVLFEMEITCTGDPHFGNIPHSLVVSLTESSGIVASPSFTTLALGIIVLFIISVLVVGRNIIKRKVT